MHQKKIDGSSVETPQNTGGLYSIALGDQTFVETFPPSISGAIKQSNLPRETFRSGHFHTLTVKPGTLAVWAVQDHARPAIEGARRDGGSTSEESVWLLDIVPQMDLSNIAIKLGLCPVVGHDKSRTVEICRLQVR